ncbi:MAG: hypothetical protein JWM56_591 [Candidatus Peribacteria bacterium]|nr:hypothetical protein [Candidatus Peribacteria bacterium]
MNRLHTVLLTCGCILALILLGTADAVFNGNHLLLPSGAQQAAGVIKQSGPDLRQIYKDLALTTSDAELAASQSLLRKVVPKEVPAESTVLLYNNDRIALFSYVQSPNAKEYFLAVKDALLPSFSPQMKDLKDETRTQPDRPVYNFLTFLDPAISEERLIFIRIQDRLYEFHVSAGQDQLVQKIIDKLTQ